MGCELQEKCQRRGLTLPKFETLAKCIPQRNGKVRKKVERDFDEKRL